MIIADGLNALNYQNFIMVDHNLMMKCEVSEIV
jgi:hypothetical protein